VKADADDKGAEEGCVGCDCMGVSYPLAGYLYICQMLLLGLVGEDAEGRTVATMSPSRCFGAIIDSLPAATEEDTQWK
jgi:hypothetical protein